MIDDLLYLSGNDIPFIQAGLVIHPPKLKEIAYISEQTFWQGCQLLRFDKSTLQMNEDKVDLSNQSNFDIIMTMIQQKETQAQSAKVCVLSILALLFPIYQIKLDKNKIILTNSQTSQIHEINNQNYDIFKNILVNMFCLSNNNKENRQYNPASQFARKLAEKFKQARQKKIQLESQQGKNKKIAIFSRYISILAVAQQKDMNDLFNYTVYQLMDEFKRYQLKLHYDTWEKYRIAGASDMEDPEDWFKDIHDEVDNFEDDLLKFNDI